jgi:hypothetical protein
MSNPRAAEKSLNAAARDASLRQPAREMRSRSTTSTRIDGPVERGIVTLRALRARARPHFIGEFDDE